MPDDSQDRTRTDDGGTGSSGSDDSTPLKRLGDFELIREIGRGGMGVVYEARQVSLKRRVALKVLPPALGMSAQAQQRFEREAQAAAKLHHTNIVPVHAIGEHDGHHFYAMDLIDGQSLDHVLRDMVDQGSNPLMEATVTQTVTELRPQRAVRSSQDQATTSLSDTSAGGREWFDTVAKLMADVAEGLHYAHGRGVIHRDIKPANLMLSREGHLSITDFGLARLLEEPGMTVSGSFLGTPAYMSPEQITAGRVRLDHRTDVYSLGAVLYEMLSMQRPFPGESREEILTGVLTKDPRPLRRFNGKIPVDLETICLKALEKDPDRRYATAGELAQDLRQHLQGGVIAARRAGPVRRSWKSIRRHPTAALAVVAVLVVSLLVGFGWRAFRQARAPRLVSDAQLALREGTYRDGLQLIDRAVALDPDSIEARLVRARLLIVNGRMREAAEEARSVLQAEPQNYAAHAIFAGLALYPHPQYRLVSIDPEPHLRVVEASAPDSAEAYCLRALRTRNTRQRIELLDRALDLDPSYQLASVARMQALLDLKDHELTLSEADRLITARPKSAQGWRFKADAYREQRDFENARNAIERAMEIDDGDPWNYVQRYWILWDMGKQDEALTELNRAIELDPAHGFLYSQRAARLNIMGRFEEAIADSRKSIELNPDDHRAFFRLLWSYLSLEQENEVRATIDELRGHAEGWFDVEAKAWASYSIADSYRQLKDYDRAMRSADQVIAIDPDGPRGFIVRMTIHKELGNDAAAEADCDAMARIEFDEPNDLLSRGQGLIFRCNRSERAIVDFDRVIGLAPKWYMGYFWRGTAYYSNLKLYDEALADLNKAIELAPFHPFAYANRAVVYFAQGRFEEALAGWERALELGSNSATSWSNYGESLVGLGRLEEALAATQRALELSPRSAHSHKNRAYTLAWLGRCDEAASEYRRAKELAPARSSAIIADAHASAFYYNCPDHYDLTEALQHARSAYEADPESHRGTLAMALFRKGDYVEAKRIGLERFDEDPKGTWFLLAMCLWHLGEETEARKFYDRSVTWMEERQPDHPERIRQRHEAAELLGIQP